MHSALLRDSLPDHGIISGSDVGESRRWLLLIDDDENMLSTLRFYFERRGFSVVVAANMVDAQAAYAARPCWALVVADYHLPDGTGWEFYCWMRDLPRPMAPFLLISGAMTGAAFAREVPFLPKPFSLEQLESRVAALLKFVR